MSSASQIRPRPRWLVALGLAAWVTTACNPRVTPDPVDGDGGTDSDDPVATVVLASSDDSGGGADTSVAQDSGGSSDTAAPARFPVVVVSDGANSRIRYVRLDTESVVFDHDLATFQPELCGADNRVCVIYGAEPSRDPVTGADRLMYVYGVSETNGGTTRKVSAHLEMVQINESEVELLWSTSTLDFTMPDGEIHPACPADITCPSPSSEAPRGCELKGTHDVEILSEGEDGFKLLIADTGSRSRVLAVTVDPDDPDCATVDQVLSDETSSEWRRFENTNDADQVTYGGEELLLVNQKASPRNVEYGQSGLGKTTLWAWRAGDWALLDEHPPRDSESEAFLNAPHNPDMVTVDGESYVLVAHSNGNGATWEYLIFDMEADHFGTIAVLKMEGDQMVYLYDGLIEGDTPLNFVRDVDILDDDTFLVLDSGCNYVQDGVCTHPGAVRHVALDLDVLPPDDASKDGRWSVDQEFMEIRPVQELDTLFDSPLTCDFLIPYEADFRWSDDFGPGVAARLDSPGEPCGE